MEYDLTTRNQVLNFGCIINRFLSKQTVVRKKLRLVGLVSMLIACKYEEVLVSVVGEYDSCIKQSLRLVGGSGNGTFLWL